MAAGVSKGQLTHQEVLLNADKHKERFKIFIEQLIILKTEEIK